MVPDLILVASPSLKEAARGYLISLKASSYSPRYIEAMELALRLFTDYAESQRWVLEDAHFLTGFAIGAIENQWGSNAPVP